MSELKYSNIKDCMNAITQTILYSDVFGFPLSKRELWYFLKSPTKISKSDFSIAFEKLPKEVLKIRGYYCLSNRLATVVQRIDRKSFNRDKYMVAKSAASILSKIPTVIFIGISGSLALGNAKKDDDIDLFVVTRKNTIWITRLVSLVILQTLGLRRKRLSVETANKVCMNMFIDEENLVLPKARHDVYTAHEIAQLKPLVDKNNTYNRFLLANEWVNMFMPNVLKVAFKKSKKFKFSKTSSRFVYRILNAYINYIFANVITENIAKVIQRNKIKMHTTNETISDSLLAFHPKDYRLVVLSKYKEKLKNKSFSRILHTYDTQVLSRSRLSRERQFHEITRPPVKKNLRSYRFP